MNNSSRILSIDIFRGITILVMVFVNDLASVTGLPWWTYHMPPGQNGLTYVDVVFPAFLFIVGMSIPLAIRKRQKKGDSYFRIIYHIIVRAMSLIFLGVLIMNGREVDPELTGISYTFWNIAMFTGVILVWNILPEKGNKNRIYYIVSKGIGVIILVFLAFIFRRQYEGQILWFDLNNSAILGGIGFAYFTCSLLFLFLNRRVLYLMLSLVGLIILNVLFKTDNLHFLKTLPSVLWSVRSGALASITMAGIITSEIMVSNQYFSRVQQKISFGILFGIMLTVLGVLLLPFGVAKIGSTPSWCMFSASLSLFIFVVLYIIVDRLKLLRWAGFIKPAGSNPLLTYILPDIYYAAFTIYHFSGFAGSGNAGVLRSLVFTFFILGMAAFLTRLKVRLQL